jgi:hypothetical protein
VSWDAVILHLPGLALAELHLLGLALAAIAMIAWPVSVILAIIAGEENPETAAPEREEGESRSCTTTRTR